MKLRDAARNLLMTLIVAASAWTGAAWLAERRGELLVRGVADQAVQEGPVSTDSAARVAASLRKLPLYFVENRGQFDSRVAYAVAGPNDALYFTQEGVRIAVACGRGGGADEPSSRAPIQKAALRTGAEASAPRRWAVRLDFVGSDPDVRIEGQQATPAVMSYFHGQSKDWKTGLPTYRAIRYAGLWPGIDLVYSGTGERLKYSFTVSPGVDPGKIRIAYRGATSLSLDESGRLEMSTPVGSLFDEPPRAYQEVRGRRVDVAAAYALDSSGGDDGHGGHDGYRFVVGAYDPTLPLVIDPAAFVYAGYIGGASDERGYGIAVDTAGNAYVTGYTLSTQDSFPVTVGPDLTYGGLTDAFVAKVKADGSGLVYCGYIGGAQEDIGLGIAVDAAGNAYVAGYTFSDESSFPVTAGPGLHYSGGSDAFVARVDASGTNLNYCGYIGGAASDGAAGIAVDSQGNAYVTGSTNSSESSFPVAVGPDVTFNGGNDAFVAKVNVSGTALDYCGYIGGSGTDYAHAIAVDSSGRAYVAGDTESSEASFPVVAGPDLTYNGGASDAFVARVSSAGLKLEHCTYIGGAGAEHAYGVAVDASRGVYVAGSTDSTESSFPVVTGPSLAAGGLLDAFVAKIRPNWSSLAYCGYIGGLKIDSASGVAVDSGGAAYVTGSTESDEITFPSVRGPDPTYNGGGDAFIAKIKPSGVRFEYCGYIGGSSNDYGYGIAVDAARNAYVTGFTLSPPSSFPILVGPNLDSAGPSDAFVAKIQPNGVPWTPTPDVTKTFTPTSPPVTLTPTNHTPTPLATVTRTPTTPRPPTPTLTFTKTKTATPAPG